MNALELPALLTAGAFLLLAQLTVLSAQQPTSPKPLDPAVQTLLDQMAKKRGLHTVPADAHLTLRGSYEVRFENMAEPVAKGTFQDLFAASGDARHTSDMGPMGKLERGIQRDVVWELDPSMGAKLRRGAHAAHVRRYCALVRGDDPRTIYREITLDGKRTVADRQLHVLRLVAAEGKPDTFLVAADGTLVAAEMLLPTPESADAAFGMDDMMEATIAFAEWRPHGKAMVPMQRTVTMGPAKVVFTASEVAVGTAIDDTLFTPPAQVLALKPAAEQPAFTKDGKPVYQIVERDEQPVATIRVKCKPQDISQTLGELLPEVMAHLTATGARMSGPPFSRYHAWGEEIDLEAGFPVQAPIEGKGRIQNSKLPGGKIVTCWHVGPYDKLTGSHAALQAHLAQSKQKARGGPWEIYWTDPGMVPDPTKWRTQLLAPIE
jgi:effector-binding domain-containing protein